VTPLNLVRLKGWAFEELGLTLEPGQLDQFETLYRELIDWNQRLNLTAITEPDQFLEKHLFDSLTALVVSTDMPSAGVTADIVDVGSGAGFPGLVLAAVRDNWRFSLLDSTQKKVRFLEHAGKEMGLHNLRAIHSRAEDFGQRTEERARYDVVVARAVSRLPVLLEYCLPLLNPTGILVAMKGPDAHEELEESQAALTELNGVIRDTVNLRLPESGDSRTLISIGLEGPVPTKYPRRPGQPEKKPL